MEFTSYIKKRKINLDIKEFTITENEIVNKIISIEQEIVTTLKNIDPKIGFEEIKEVDKKLSELYIDIGYYTNLSKWFRHINRLSVTKYLRQIEDDVTLFIKKTKLIEKGFYLLFISLRGSTSLSANTKSNQTNLEKFEMLYNQELIEGEDFEFKITTKSGQMKYVLRFTGSKTFEQIRNVCQIDLIENTIKHIINLSNKEKDLAKTKYLLGLSIGFISKLAENLHKSRIKHDEPTTHNTRIISEISQIVVNRVNEDFKSFLDKSNIKNSLITGDEPFFESQFHFRDLKKRDLYKSVKLYNSFDLRLYLLINNLTEISRILLKIFDSISLKKINKNSQFYSKEHNYYYDENDIDELDGEIGSHLNSYLEILELIQGQDFSKTEFMISAYQFGLYLLRNIYSYFSNLGYEKKMIYSSTFFYQVSDPKQFKLWIEFDSELRTKWIANDEALKIENLNLDCLLSKSTKNWYSVKEDEEIKALKLIKQNAFIYKQIKKSKSRLNSYKYLMFSVPFANSYQRALERLEENHSKIIDFSKGVNDEKLSILLVDSQIKTHKMLFESSTNWKRKAYKAFSKIEFRRSAREWIILSAMLVVASAVIRYGFVIVSNL